MSTRVSSTRDRGSKRKVTESELGSNGGSNGALQNKATLSKAWKRSMPVLQHQQQQSPSKKLLVLDVNGLLVARYKNADRSRPRDVEQLLVGKTRIYKRPLCNAFLQFCLENFHVGIWSSMMECNLNKALDYICMSSTTMAETTMKHRFAFVMHQMDCTTTKFTSPEKRDKPIFLKDLRKVWARFRPGEFNEKNTLLIDDTPYKALHNPPHTAIFPEAYVYDETDNFLMGPLRRFLVQLIGAPDVQEFVRSHPIGLPAIKPGGPHWGLYANIVNASYTRSSNSNTPKRLKGSQVSNSHSPIQLKGSQVSSSHTPIQLKGSQVSNSDTPVQLNGSQVSNSHTPKQLKGSQVSSSHTPKQLKGSQVSNSDTPINLMGQCRVIEIQRIRKRRKKRKREQPSS